VYSELTTFVYAKGTLKGSDLKESSEYPHHFPASINTV